MLQGLNRADLSPTRPPPPGQLILGGLDSLIRVYNFDAASLVDSTDTQAINAITSEPFQVVQEHYDNITCLRSYTSTASASGSGSGSDTASASGQAISSSGPPLLLSASWDATARSFRRDAKGKWSVQHVLKGHKSAVWGVECVNARPGEEKYLTGEWRFRPSGPCELRLLSEADMRVNAG
jgi:WD40 repeat protein